MRHGLAALAAAVTMLGLCSLPGSLSAGSLLARGLAGLPRPAPQLRRVDGEDYRRQARSRHVAGYALDRRSYRWAYGYVGYGRPYLRYVYRCRRFSYQCARLPTRGAYAAAYAGYDAYAAAAPRRARAPEPPVRLGRYYVYPEIDAPPRGAEMGAEDEAFYDGREVAVRDRSGAFARIASPGRSARWVRIGTPSAR